MAEATFPRGRTGGWIAEWDPEDKGFWENEGRRVAWRNLVFSVFAEFLGFATWQLFSIVAALLPVIGYDFTPAQLFGLVALPPLVGATLRFPYTFAVGIFGGRNWTVISALLLLIPTVMLGVIVQDPQTPYWLFAVAAALGGLGGGNFASSMANISYFFPDARKGTALGINAAGGNLGVGIVQLIVPFLIVAGVVIGGAQTNAVTGSQVHVQNAAFFWVPLVLLSALCAYLFMDNLHVSQATPREQAPVAKRKHAWIMSYLYIGTFGSFIGYSASFPVLIGNVFPEYTATWLAALGPIVGSLVRPLGGWLADGTGGARVTLWTFVTMVLGVASVLYFLSAHSFAGFFVSFMVLFATTGIGNGSTYRMIPTIFRTQRVRMSENEGTRAEAARLGLKEGSFVLGFAGAIGAYGGFIIPRAFGASVEATGGPQSALACFIAFYLTCIAVTWWFYYRRGAEMPC